MDTFAPTARPPYAVCVWSDDNNIYVELPTVDGPPYVMRLPFTEGGLAKALYLLRKARAEAPKPITGDFDVSRHPKIMAKIAGKLVRKDQFTEDQRAAALKALKKAGIL